LRDYSAGQCILGLCDGGAQLAASLELRYRGPPSFFITPDMDSPTRMLANACDVSMQLPSLVERHRVLAVNPVAAAIVYKRWRRCLIDLQPSYMRRRTATVSSAEARQCTSLSE
jgi:hypothetical protein